MEPTELQARPSPNWLRYAAVGLVAAVAVSAVAVGFGGGQSRKTSLGSDDTVGTAAPSHLASGAGGDASDTPTSVDDSWMFSTPTTLHSTSVPQTTVPSAGDVAGMDDPTGPTTTITPDPLIVEYATTKGGSPNFMAAGFDDDVWFTESNSNRIGRITTAGKLQEFATDGFSRPGPITRGPDRAMWFVEMARPRIGRITEAGVITEFPVPGLMQQDWGIVTGPDNALWFTSFNDTALIGRMTTGGAVTTWPLGTCPSQIAIGSDDKLWVTECVGPLFHKVSLDGTSVDVTPAGMPSDGYKYEMTAGPDDALWFASNGTSATAGKIGRLAPATGTVTWCGLPGLAESGAAPHLITTGPDGAIWFTILNDDKVVRMTTDCKLRSFDASRPQGITWGPDGNIWFTEQYDKVARIDLSQL